MSAQLALITPATTQCGHARQGAHPAQRVFLYANELYRVPATYRHVHARQGVAHISQAGRDYVVSSGDCVTLQRGADMALVSPLQSDALILELY